MAKLVQAQGNNKCFNAVQDRIAWNEAGNTSWSPANINNLCKGAENSVEPGRCFETVMQRRVSHGEGYQWSWSEATELCRGTRNSAETISCFKKKIGQGVSFARARAACQWKKHSTNALKAASGTNDISASGRTSSRWGINPYSPIKSQVQITAIGYARQ